MIPFVEMTWEAKAPSFAKIDDVIGKLRKHYGTLYTDKAEFAKVLQFEQTNF